MRYLIDTNIFIYLAMDKDLLEKHVLEILEDYENTLYISAESLKELVLFYRNRKKKPQRWKDETALIESVETEFGLKSLPVKKEHILTYSRLQVNRQGNHNDPSDHIIIAQAITEKMSLISSDRKFSYYTGQKLDFILNDK